MSSGHDSAAALINCQTLWLAVQDLHTIKSVILPTRGEGDLISPHPQLRPIAAGEGAPIFF